jgi:hypothetical protein
MSRLAADPEPAAGVVEERLQLVQHRVAEEADGVGTFEEPTFAARSRTGAAVRARRCAGTATDAPAGSAACRRCRWRSTRPRACRSARPSQPGRRSGWHTSRRRARASRPCPDAVPRARRSLSRRCAECRRRAASVPWSWEPGRPRRSAARGSAAGGPPAGCGRSALREESNVSRRPARERWPCTPPPPRRSRESAASGC